MHSCGSLDGSLSLPTARFRAHPDITDHASSHVCPCACEQALRWAQASRVACPLTPPCPPVAGPWAGWDACPASSTSARRPPRACPVDVGGPFQNLLCTASKLSASAIPVCSVHPACARWQGLFWCPGRQCSALPGRFPCNGWAVAQAFLSPKPPTNC